MLVQIIVSVIILAPVLWLVGRVILGKEKFSHAVWIVVLGVVINAFLGMYVSGLLGMLVTLVVWIALIKHFFETSWGRAALVGILAIVVLAIVAAVLVFIGIGALAGFERLV